MRFIITEEEKIKILSLYEQKNNDILITKKNPYKYPEYQDLEPKGKNESNRKIKEMYYDWDESLLRNSVKKFIIDFYTPLLLNKTMRSDKNDIRYNFRKIKQNDILKITKIEPWSIKLNEFTNHDISYDLTLYFNNDEMIWTTIEMPESRPSVSTKYNIPNNYKAGDYIPTNSTNFFTVTPSQQLIEYLKDNPFNWVEARKKIPDNIFSIYKKTSTDFQP